MIAWMPRVGDHLMFQAVESPWSKDLEDKDQVKTIFQAF